MCKRSNSTQYIAIFTGGFTLANEGDYGCEVNNSFWKTDSDEEIYTDSADVELNYGKYLLLYVLLKCI